MVNHGRLSELKQMGYFNFYWLCLLWGLVTGHVVLLFKVALWNYRVSN